MEGKEYERIKVVSEKFVEEVEKRDSIYDEIWRKVYIEDNIEEATDIYMKSKNIKNKEIKISTQYPEVKVYIFRGSVETGYMFVSTKELVKDIIEKETNTIMKEWAKKIYEFAKGFSGIKEMKKREISKVMKKTLKFPLKRDPVKRKEQIEDIVKKMESIVKNKKNFMEDISFEKVKEKIKVNEELMNGLREYKGVVFVDKGIEGDIYQDFHDPYIENGYVVMPSSDRGDGGFRNRFISRFSIVQDEGMIEGEPAILVYEKVKAWYKGAFVGVKEKKWVIRKKNGKMDVVRVYRTAKNVREAIDMLIPLEVERAKKEGREVKRLGDIWFVKISDKNKNKYRFMEYEVRKGYKVYYDVYRKVATKYAIHSENGKLDLGSSFWKVYVNKRLEDYE